MRIVIIISPQCPIYSGREFTQRALVTLASQWLGDPLNRIHTVTPLLDWTLKLQKEVIYPLGIATAEALPWTKVLSAECFSSFEKKNITEIIAITINTSFLSRKLLLFLL
jgi:hypothetical protein